MRTPPFLLIGVPCVVAVLAVGYFATHPGVRQTTVPADPPAGASTTSADVPTPDSRKVGAGKHHLMDQLDLTDAQKQQIAQLRQTITDHKERHQAILKVLTPEQRTKLKELRAESSASPTPSSAPPAVN
jgi:Spy/CpxP family protein refolding chaperone